MIDRKERNIEIMRMIRQIGHHMRSKVKENFRNFDITGVQMMTVKILRQEGPLKITELSDKLSLSNSTVSGIVDRLEKREIVERKRSQEDRRVVMVELNDKFKRGADDFFKDIEAYWHESLGVASEEELDKVFTGLHTLKDILERVDNEE